MTNIDDFKIGVLIPTINAGLDWAEFLENIKSQSIIIQKKIIIDSGSTDNTVELAKEFGFEVIDIKKSEFNHGATRQQMVDACTGIDICVFLTQDAILASTDSIANIVAAFDNPQIGMAYGRQLPRLNAKSLETHARLFNYPEQSAIRSFADKEAMGFKVFFCSNSFSAYRKTALLRVGGFPSDSIMGEDALVAARMLMNGFKIAYIANARVYHSHTYTLKEEYRRYFDTRVFHEQNKWLIDEFGKPTGEGLRFIKSELLYIIKSDLKSLPKSIISVGAKWLGYNSGRFYKKMPLSILKKLSMHSFYWK